MTYDFKEAQGKWQKSIELLLQWVESNKADGSDVEIDEWNRIVFRVDDNWYCFNPRDLEEFFDQQEIYVAFECDCTPPRKRFGYSVETPNEYSYDLDAFVSRSEALQAAYDKAFDLLEQRLTV